jgi:hypothetical protein
MRILTIDTETHLADFESKVRTNWEPPDLVVVGAKFKGERYHQYEWSDDGAGLKVADMIEEADVVVFHNATFDVGVLARWSRECRRALVDAIRREKVADTKVIYRMIDPELHHNFSLAGLAHLLFGVEMDKGAVRTSFRREVPTTHEQSVYLEQDVRITERVYLALNKLPQGHFTDTPYSVEINAGPPAGYKKWFMKYSSAAAAAALTLEEEGLYFNKPGWDEAWAYAQGVLQETEQGLVNTQLARIVSKQGANTHFSRTNPFPSCVPGRAWRPASMTQMMRKVKSGYERREARVQLDLTALRTAYKEFADRNSIDFPVSEKTGELSLTYKFWKQYRTQLPRQLQTHLRYAKAAKLRDAFLNPLRGIEDGTPIFPSYFIPGTETARWSCSRPNIQQLEKARRNLYRATRLPKDPYAQKYVFVGADYKSLELYTLAHCMQALGIRGPLMEALETGEDLHTRSARGLFPDENPCQAADDEYKRKVAKVANFSLAGGMGVKAFFRQGCAAGIDWTQGMAARVREQWFELYPDVEAYIRQFRVSPWDFRPRNVDTETWLRHLGFDNKRWPSSWDLMKSLDDGCWFDCTLPSGRLIPRRQFSAGANCFFQGTGADVITEAFLRCFDAGLQVAAVVHDSIVVRCEEGEEEEVGKTLSWCMMNALRLVCPSVPIPPVQWESKEVLF